MNSSATSLSARHAEPISHTAILSWMDEVRAGLKAEPWAELLDFDGVDAFDVLLSPIYLSVLKAVREGAGQPQSSTAKMVGRIWDWAYQRKMAYFEKMAAGKSAPPGPVDVLLWSRDITHTAVLHPVASALVEQGTSCRMLACHVNVFEGLRQRDPDSVFTFAAWPSTVHEARREGRRRARHLHRSGPWKIPQFSRATKADLRPVVRQTVTQFLPLVSEAIANTRAALERFAPRVLVVGNDLTVEGRAGCRVAAQRGVPTAQFMHGSITGSALQSLHCADRILVYGNIHRRELVQQGIAPERISVCGAPHLNHHSLSAERMHPLLQARLGLRTGDPWILVATSGPGHSISHRHHQVVIQNLQQLSERMPDLPVVVKLHRKDRLDYYRQGLKDRVHSKLLIVPEGTRGFPSDIFAWLRGCRVVLTGASTVAVEAMLMDVPVITMDFCDEIHKVDFIDAGATVHVRTSEALEQSVREVLAAGRHCPEVQSRVQTYLNEAFCALDGSAASRSAGVLREMIEVQ